MGGRVDKTNPHQSNRQKVQDFSLSQQHFQMPPLPVASVFRTIQSQGRSTAKSDHKDKEKLSTSFFPHPHSSLFPETFSFKCYGTSFPNQSIQIKGALRGSIPSVRWGSLFLSLWPGSSKLNHALNFPKYPRQLDRFLVRFVLYGFTPLRSAFHGCAYFFTFTSSLPPTKPTQGPTSTDRHRVPSRFLSSKCISSKPARPSLSIDPFEALERAFPTLAAGALACWLRGLVSYKIPTMREKN